MRKLLFITILSFCAYPMAAQPWMKKTEGPVKLSEIVEAYNKTHKDEVKDPEAEEGEEEGKRYHFDRWLWYWQQHTDQNGYLVSPAKTLQEVQKLQNRYGNAMSKTTADPSNWTFEGPFAPPGHTGTGLGRINVIGFHPTDDAQYWVGTPGGGAWKTTDDGQSWTEMTTDLPVLGVSAIVINHQNPNTVYIGTGDRDGSDTYGVGVLKSTDGGQNWDTTNLRWEVSEFETVTGLVMNAQDTNSLTVATSEGIYKTFDGGDVWTLAQGGRFKQLLSHPTDTSIIYATGRIANDPYQIWRSIDGGLNWQATTNMPTNSRIEIAVTPHNPAIVKAVVANTSYGVEGVYTSSDNGASFIKIYDDPTCDSNILASNKNGNSCGGQGWYDLAIVISPTDSNTVLVGGVRTWMSTDGGKTFDFIEQFISPAPGVVSVHVDKHYLMYHPLKQNTLYECNDGGIYSTTAPAANMWTKHTNGLGITQFYRNAVADNATFVLGGSQDNGTKQLLANGSYDNVTGADGMECQIDYTNSNIFYSTYQYGRLWRTTNGGSGNFTDITPQINGSRATGEWITPFIIHPTNPNFLFAGYEFLMYSTNKGNSWIQLPYFFGDDIDRIAMSPASENTIYIIDANTARVSRNLGATWQLLPPTFGNKSDIAVSPWDSNQVWVCFSGYGGNKVATYNPTDGWQYINDSLPDVPVNCVAIDSANGTIYAGTDIGVFYKDPANNYWEPFRNNMPNVEIRDLGINYATNEIWAATYGRGMWKSVKHATTTSLKNVAENITGDVTVYPNPANGKFNIQLADRQLYGKVLKVNITDISGKTVWQNTITGAQTVAGIDATSLPQGNYMLTISYAERIVSKEKLVIIK